MIQTQFKAKVSQSFPEPEKLTKVIQDSPLRSTVCKNQAKLELLYTDQLKCSSFLSIILHLSE